MIAMPASIRRRARLAIVWAIALASSAAAAQLRQAHLVDAVDDLEEGAGGGLHAPGRNQLRGVDGGVIDDVVDDVEARRLVEQLRQLAARSLLRLGIDRH